MWEQKGNLGEQWLSAGRRVNLQSLPVLFTGISLLGSHSLGFLLGVDLATS